MSLFERLILVLLRDGKKHMLSVKSRPQNRFAPQNGPQIPKEELGPFLAIFGTRMRAFSAGI